MRFWLSVWGLLWAVSGTAVFALAERPGWAIACAVLSVAVMAHLLVVVHRLYEAPHDRPGRGVPPHEPDRGDGRRHR
ncbi:hypothetical protein SCWH03_14250 [Streptomyces pacificus]|uniref:Uncharacterized protein n=2 Tax=Streptomyces pacificus TaxID=2705029 RepID=A0A6A0AQH6_9ACTN|nr:hypothetical protein SCWH03_14250 [Streptomyces pacificus]